MSTPVQSEMGFVPKTEVKNFLALKVDAGYSTVIYKYGAVQLSGGYAIRAATTGNVAGIAVHGVDATDETSDVDIIVINDPSVVFEVPADEAFVITDVGKYVGLASNAGTGYRSTAHVALSAASATATANLPFIIVGQSNSKAATTNNLILVKLAEPVLDRGLDAT